MYQTYLTFKGLKITTLLPNKIKGNFEVLQERVISNFSYNFILKKRKN